MTELEARTQGFNEGRSYVVAHLVCAYTRRAHRHAYWSFVAETREKRTAEVNEALSCFADAANIGRLDPYLAPRHKRMIESARKAADRAATEAVK